MKRILTITTIFFTLLSCRDSREHVTDSGLRYLLYTDGKGKKPVMGDYVTMELVCHTDDTVMIDTRKLGTPFRLQLKTIPFVGSYEEGLLLLGVGDSATFFVSADSLYESLFADVKQVRQSDTKLKPGSFVQYDVKVLKVQPYSEAEIEMQMQYSKLQRQEKKVLTEFIERNKIDASPDSNGLYKIMTVQGSGLRIDTGKSVTVYYRSRLMDGSLISATEKGKPMRFVPGRNEVLKGWEIAFRNARVGDRFSLIMPSSLAYGETGLKDATTAKYIVPPYSTLIFDIAIDGVGEPETASK
ncbi:MAG: hypothetical protein RL021_601 [Bacteroidota bacterium]|jgi:FKBP-type peptidyl-prolyl cis-trans isomerase